MLPNCSLNWKILFNILVKLVLLSKCRNPPAGYQQLTFAESICSVIHTIITELVFCFVFLNKLFKRKRDEKQGFDSSRNQILVNCYIKLNPHDVYIYPWSQSLSFLSSLTLVFTLSFLWFLSAFITFKMNFIQYLFVSHASSQKILSLYYHSCTEELRMTNSQLLQVTASFSSVQSLL